VTWENGVEHSGSRGFADTEGDGGSTPPAPTTKSLTSRNAGQLAVRGRFGGPCTGMESVRCFWPAQGPCTGWRAFPMLNLPVHGPPARDPLISFFEGTCIPGTAHLGPSEMGCASGSLWGRARAAASDTAPRMREWTRVVRPRACASRSRSSSTFSGGVGAWVSCRPVSCPSRSQRVACRCAAQIGGMAGAAAQSVRSSMTGQ
jgi:hypothetical protein